MPVSDQFCVSAVLRAWRAELDEDGVGLLDWLSVGAVLADLYRLSDRSPPADVEAALDALALGLRSVPMGGARAASA